MAPAGRPLDIFLVAGEASGDHLGASFMRSAKARFGAEAVAFRGVGGEAMRAEGLAPLFPSHDITAMGFGAVIAGLPRLLRRLAETVAALRARPPDLLLTIDSPDFCLRVTRRLRRTHPAVPIVHWVCPSVWAWRPGRARRMRPHVDHVLCLLPFEPAALARLGGPPGTYVGHPLIERLADLRPSPDERARRDDEANPEVLILPGSRRGELDRLLPVFAEVAARVAARHPTVRFTLPTLPRFVETIATAVAGWPTPPTVVSTEADKYAAFRRARCALAASGTVSLELGLAGVPSVIAYRVGAIEGAIARKLIQVPTVVLANLVLGEVVMPQFLQQDCRADGLAPALVDLIAATPARARQIEGLARIDAMMLSPDGRAPSERALDAVAAILAGRAPQRR